MHARKNYANILVWFQNQDPKEAGPMLMVEIKDPKFSIHRS
jgi:hypothetical protein